MPTPAYFLRLPLVLVNEKALVATSFLRTAELVGKEVRDVRLNSVLWGKDRAGLCL